MVINGGGYFINNVMDFLFIKGLSVVLGDDGLDLLDCGHVW